jgi:hypothetical protein
MELDRKYAVQVKPTGTSRWLLHSAAQYLDRGNAERVVDRAKAEEGIGDARLVTITTTVGEPGRYVLDAMIARLAVAADSYDEPEQSQAYKAGGFDAAVQVARIVFGWNWEMAGEYVAEAVQESIAANYGG